MLVIEDIFSMIFVLYPTQKKCQNIKSIDVAIIIFDDSILILFKLEDKIYKEYSLQQ
jgi:hypothetical protein